MIPARMGSSRLAMKNLALVNGEPMIYYAIDAARKARVFSSVIVNSESIVFEEIASRYGVEFYQRPEILGGSTIKSDDVVYDFMKSHPGDITAWVNSTSPLQSAREVRDVVNYFQKERLDSLITVCEEQVHCLYGGNPLNFSEKGLFAQTQDLVPIQRFVYSIMMWRNNIFIRTYEKQGYAFFCGKTGYYPVSRESAIIVKTEEDLKLVHFILKGKACGGKFSVHYNPTYRKKTSGQKAAKK
jgi:CMP-N-acetylneuraminic acid synthetase